MKYILAVCISTIISLTTVIGQIKSYNVPKQAQRSEVVINIDTLKTRTIIDTLKVQVLPSLKDNQQNNTMPLITLIVCAATILVNYIIAKVNKDTAIRNMDVQISTSTDLAKKQIDSSKEIVLQQINNSQILALNEFNATLLTKNRQEWVNDLRTTMSDLSTQCRLLNIEFQELNQNEDRKKLLHEKVTFNRTKILLLLDPSKKMHKDILDAIIKLMTALDIHMLNTKNKVGTYDNLDFMQKNDKVIETCRLLLYSEWGKIQDLTSAINKAKV